MLKEYRKAHFYADRALRRKADNVKALYNRAIAGSYLDLFEEAEADFKKVLLMNPRDAKAKSEYDKLKSKISQGKKQK